MSEILNDEQAIALTDHGFDVEEFQVIEEAMRVLSDKYTFVPNEPTEDMVEAALNTFLCLKFNDPDYESETAEEIKNRIPETQVTFHRMLIKSAIISAMKAAND